MSSIVTAEIPPKSSITDTLLLARLAPRGVAIAFDRQKRLAINLNEQTALGFAGQFLGAVTK